MSIKTAMFTDCYELSMISAALDNKTAGRRASFELFTRKLAGGRRYGVVAGINRVLEAIEAFRFTDSDIEFVTNVVHPQQDCKQAEAKRAQLAEWMEQYRFTGRIWAYPDGELFFDHSPVLTVHGTFADAIVLETVLLSILNHDCAVATAASHMTEAAKGQALIEMGGRRTHENAAVASGVAACIGGFYATSNLAAADKYQIPAVGTCAHAFVLAYRSELEAFEAQIDSAGVGTTLLVDTFDTTIGIDTAVHAAQQRGASGPGAVRIDSGDLLVEAQKARKQLDEAGAYDTKIVVSSDLNEKTIAELADGPIDGFGVGTSVVAGDGYPSCGFVYKLVAIEHDGEMIPVAKRSAAKASFGGAKWSYRKTSKRGDGVIETLVCDTDGDQLEVAPKGDGRVVQKLVFNNGNDGPHCDTTLTGANWVDNARKRRELSLDELGGGQRQLQRVDYNNADDCASAGKTEHIITFGQPKVTS